jgi:hypothetical protein
MTKTVDLGGHREHDYTFVVDLDPSAYAAGATICFVETAT